MVMAMERVFPGLPDRL
jgi:hypothetical protein